VRQIKIYLSKNLNPFSPTLFLIVAEMSLPKRSLVSARVPECQKIKKGGLDQYDPEHFEV